MANVGGVTGPQESKFSPEKVKEAKWKVFRDIKLTNWTSGAQVKEIIKQVKAGKMTDAYVLERFSTKVLNKLSDNLGQLSPQEAKAFREVLTEAHDISYARRKMTKVEAFEKALSKLPQAPRMTSELQVGQEIALEDFNSYASLDEAKNFDRDELAIQWTRDNHYRCVKIIGTYSNVVVGTNRYQNLVEFDDGKGVGERQIDDSKFFFKGKYPSEPPSDQNPAQAAQLQLLKDLEEGKATLKNMGFDEL